MALSDSTHGFGPPVATAPFPPSWGRFRYEGDCEFQVFPRMGAEGAETLRIRFRCR